jgi:hypothetical protein
MSPCLYFQKCSEKWLNPEEGADSGDLLAWQVQFTQKQISHDFWIVNLTKYFTFIFDIPLRGGTIILVYDLMLQFYETNFQ